MEFSNKSAGPLHYEESSCDCRLSFRVSLASWHQSVMIQWNPANNLFHLTIRQRGRQSSCHQRKQALLILYQRLGMREPRLYSRKIYSWCEPLKTINQQRPFEQSKHLKIVPKWSSSILTCEPRSQNCLRCALSVRILKTFRRTFEHSQNRSTVTVWPKRFVAL